MALNGAYRPRKASGQNGTQMVKLPRESVG